jgi:hypothetical protein
MEMAQHIAVAFLFAVALVYIGRIVYRQVRAKSTCGSSSACSGCGSETDARVSTKNTKISRPTSTT